MRVCKVPSRVGGLAATTELKGITHIVGSEELCIEMMICGQHLHVQCYQDIELLC